MTRNEIIMQTPTAVAQAFIAELSDILPAEHAALLAERVTRVIEQDRTRTLIERSRVWRVSWNIDVEGAATPAEAARRVWVEQFGRSPQPAADEACVFLVKSALTGDSVLVDLSEVAA